jgi:hypothetical protein
VRRSRGIDPVLATSGEEGGMARDVLMRRGDVPAGDQPPCALTHPKEGSVVMQSSKRGFSTSAHRVLRLAVAAALVGGLGCGAAGNDESVSEVQEAATAISTWNGLVRMGSTGSYTLTANINASGKTWTPKAFSGSLDGRNFTISNLTISSGSFFSTLTNASIRNLKFINLTISGSHTEGIGGIATRALGSTIQNCAVEASINVSANAVGGLVGTMTGGSVYRSYAKGTIGGSIFFAGGLVGIANWGSVGTPSIYESYAQVTVNPDTSGSWPVVAGGIVGSGSAPYVYDVYAVGNVTGRGGVGGIVGELTCQEDDSVVYKTIYRGNVVDQNWSSNGGWAGGIGTLGNCNARVTQNFYDRSLDSSTNHANHNSILGYTTTELISPTTVTGGVFCNMDVVPDRCGDNTWSTPPWTPGTSSQHHVLQNMPGPNEQLR